MTENTMTTPEAAPQMTAKESKAHAKAAKAHAKATNGKVAMNLAGLTVLSEPGTALVQETDPRPAIGAGAIDAANAGEVVADDDPLA